MIYVFIDGAKVRKTYQTNKFSGNNLYISLFLRTFAADL